MSHKDGMQNNEDDTTYNDDDHDHNDFDCEVESTILVEYDKLNSKNENDDEHEMIKEIEDALLLQKNYNHDHNDNDNNNDDDSNDVMLLSSASMDDEEDEYERMKTNVDTTEEMISSSSLSSMRSTTSSLRPGNDANHENNHDDANDDDDDDNDKYDHNVMMDEISTNSNFLPQQQEQQDSVVDFETHDSSMEHEENDMDEYLLTIDLESNDNVVAPTEYVEDGIPTKNKKILEEEEDADDDIETMEITEKNSIAVDESVQEDDRNVQQNLERNEGHDDVLNDDDGIIQDNEYLTEHFVDAADDGAVDHVMDDIDYPSGSDSTTFVDRMDLADAYDDGVFTDIIMGETDGNYGDERSSHSLMDESHLHLVDVVDESANTDTYIQNDVPPEPLQTANNAPTVQYIITANMRRCLIRELGYSPMEVNCLKPDIAAVLVNKMLKRPKTGMPNEFYIEGTLPQVGDTKCVWKARLGKTIRKVAIPLIISGLSIFGVIILNSVVTKDNLEVNNRSNTGVSTIPDQTAKNQTYANEKFDSNKLNIVGEESQKKVGKQSRGSDEPEEDATKTEDILVEDPDKPLIDKAISFGLEKIDELLKRPF